MSTASPDRTDRNRPAIRLAAVDMAGTSVDDGGAVESAFRTALDTVGLDPDRPRGSTDRTAGSASTDRAAGSADTDRTVRATMGQAKLAVFTRLLGGDAIRAARANAVFEDALGDAVDRGLVVPVDGARTAIESLQARGVAVCLTTGFSPATRDRILAGLGWTGLADLVLSPADAGRGRPWPDMILTAVLRLGIEDVAEVAAVGDTTSDLIAGTRAGASLVVGVLTGAHGLDELLTAPHTHVIGSIRELPDLVETHGPAGRSHPVAADGDAATP